MDELQSMGAIPFDVSVLQSVFPDCRQITDKAIRLESEGRLIRLKRGLYVANVKDGTLSRELIANHLYGPSYVSMSWALRWHGLIPERVYLIQSLTTKHSRKFTTPLGEFHFQNCPAEYFPLGITIQGNGNSRYQIASPEKALCDYICYNKVNLRFMKDVGQFLEEDLRFDTSVLSELDTELIEKCAITGKNSKSLFTLLKYLQYDRHI